MLKSKIVKEPFPDIEKIQNLYICAFPENERRPFEELVSDPRGANQMIAFYDDAEFVGFVVLMDSKIDISYLTFFAVEEKLRSNGYGTKILSEVHRMRAGRRIIVDVEFYNPWAKNKQQRRKRRAFYFRNGYKQTAVLFRTRKENFQFLVYGGKFTNKDLQMFWKSVRG